MSRPCQWKAALAGRRLRLQVQWRSLISRPNSRRSLSASIYALTITDTTCGKRVTAFYLFIIRIVQKYKTAVDKT